MKLTSLHAQEYHYYELILLSHFLYNKVKRKTRHINFVDWLNKSSTIKQSLPVHSAIIVG